MKSIWTILILLLAINVNAQPSNSGNITNEFTDAHFALPGTQVSIAPPVDFRYSEALSGFEIDDAQITVATMEGGFHENSTKLAKAKLEAEGFTDVMNYKVKINGVSAIYAEGTSGSSKQCQLVIGDDSSAVLIVGTANASNTALLTEIKNSILSVIYE